MSRPIYTGLSVCTPYINFGLWDLPSPLMGIFHLCHVISLIKHRKLTYIANYFITDPRLVIVLHWGLNGHTGYFEHVFYALTNFLLPLPGQSYSGVWKELPKDWLEGLNVAKQVRYLYFRT